MMKCLGLPSVRNLRSATCSLCKTKRLCELKCIETTKKLGNLEGSKDLFDLGENFEQEKAGNKTFSLAQDPKGYEKLTNNQRIILSRLNKETQKRAFTLLKYSLDDKNKWDNPSYDKVTKWIGTVYKAIKNGNATDEKILLSLAVEEKDPEKVVHKAVLAVSILSAFGIITYDLGNKSYKLRETK